MNYNEPGVGRLTGAGALVGACTAVLATSVVALSQWLAGAQMSIVLSWSLQLLLLLGVLCSSLGALFALVYYTRRLMPLEPPEKEDIVYVDPYPAQQAAEMEEQASTLAEQIVENAVQQAWWHYNYDKNPSRRAMEEQGVPQAIWNSARAVLQEAGILHRDKWDPLALGRIERIHADGDKIWVPNDRGLRVLVVSDQLVGNSYISPPTPLTGRGGLT